MKPIFMVENYSSKKTSLPTYFYNSDDIQSLHAHEGHQINAVHMHSFKVGPVNANLHPVITENDPATYFNNYFLENNYSKWASYVRLFSFVIYQNLFPLTDMKFCSSLNDIKYDIILHLEANPNDIQLSFEGVDKLSLKMAI